MWEVLFRTVIQSNCGDNGFFFENIMVISIRCGVHKIVLIVIIVYVF